MLNPEHIFDVILLTTGNFQTSQEEFQTHIPPLGDLPLSNGFWFGRLPLGVSPETVFNACESPGWNFKPARQYGMRYALCREVTPRNNDYYHWDHDGAIGTTVLLSRFIHPTTMGSSLSARLYFRNDELQQIVAGPTQSNCSHAWVASDDRYRDWLSVPELEQLRELLPKYDRQANRRVRMARKHIDNAFYMYFLDQRFASIVSAFESLLKTSKSDLTEQFKTRALRLAQMLGSELSREDLHSVYGHRSDFVHGSRPSFEGLPATPDAFDVPEDLDSRLVGRYVRCENVLRLALLRESTEPAFAALFASDTSIEATFGSPTKKSSGKHVAADFASVSDDELKTECERRYGKSPRSTTGA